VKPWSFGSGPAVARLFHRLLALVFLDAWLSLAAQWKQLIGSRGLLPAAEFVQALRDRDFGLLDAPTLFRWITPSDGALGWGIALGVALSLLALWRLPRLWLALNVPLYLSYVVVGRTFFSFQWDNLLLECGFFAIFLPRDRQAPIVHLLFRLILFKLYWESGIAKWASHLHDWQDGSAMTFYYETAPLPAAGAWLAHHLPAAWHHFESWMTLAFELIVPFFAFGPRRWRLFAAVFLTFFQIVNALTANYGFFCYLAIVLHVFLLDDGDVERLRARLKLAPLADRALTGWRKTVTRALTLALAFGFAFASTVEALGSFTEPGPWFGKTEPLRKLYAPFRVINTYHLFGHITRERIEPALETFDGTTWTEHSLRYKPGPLDRRPPYVAPHQPRLDFQLWFYGLSYQHGTPPYVANLLDRACNAPEVLAPLFEGGLPPKPEAVRLRFWRYRFSAHLSGGWWTREQENETRPIPCR